MGSLEASVAQQATYRTYDAHLNKDFRPPAAAGEAPATGPKKDSPMDVQRSMTKAIQVAQAMESHSFHEMLNLSMQELIDCDRVLDEGCRGGNPLLAFYFMHKFGLTMSECYPYVGLVDGDNNRVKDNNYHSHCCKDFAELAVASVCLWGVIESDFKNHMEFVLRFIGPIVVGFNGADPSFLTYSGSIFDKENCKQHSNHALLIVGYGQKETHASTNTTLGGTITKYWIACNLWGKGWGENGFVRIAHPGGSVGMPGVCGIAKNPSVALGGFLLQQQQEQPLPYVHPKANNEGDGSPSPESLVGFLFALVGIWIMTWLCRRRHQVIRQRKEHIMTSQRHGLIENILECSKTSSLLQTPPWNQSNCQSLPAGGKQVQMDEVCPTVYGNHSAESQMDVKRTKPGILHTRSAMAPAAAAQVPALDKKSEAKLHECVTICFCDIYNYATISSQLSPQQGVNVLDCLYMAWDQLCKEHDVYRFESVGNVYMLATNFIKEQLNHVQIMTNFVMDIMTAATQVPVDVKL